MRAVLIVELELPEADPDALEASVHALKQADVPHATNVLRVAVGEIADRVLESINPPKH